MRSSWSSGENAARRERANYAWQHPSRRPPPPSSSTTSSSYAHNPGSSQGFAGSTTGQFNPFARREANGFPQEDHYHRFAARDAKLRQQKVAANNGGKGNAGGHAGHHTSSRFASVATGTEGFGAKAEEVCSSLSLSHVR